MSSNLSALNGVGLGFGYHPDSLQGALDLQLVEPQIRNVQSQGAPRVEFPDLSYSSCSSQEISLRQQDTLQ